MVGAVGEKFLKSDTFLTFLKQFLVFFGWGGERFLSPPDKPLPQLIPLILISNETISGKMGAEASRMAG